MSGERQLISSGTVWEGIVGYSRAVRVDRFVFVAGTTATGDDGAVVGTGDPGAQTDFILQKIERALREAGASLNDVVRTRIYLTSVDDWEAVGRIHGRYFADIRPANTLVEVSALVGDDYLVEIEADAVIGDRG
jgi:enamine deaminase RidA (YjgF/YER057c/UK114 family)